MRFQLATILVPCLLLANVVGANHHSEAAAAPPSQPSIVPGSVEPSPPGSGTGEMAVRWAAPPGWQVEEPANAMRVAQYRVAGDAGDAICVVFYLGLGEGGDPTSNAARWANQFTLADGRPGKEGLSAEKRKVGNIGVLVVSVSGTHQDGFEMEAQPSPAKPNQMLLGAILMGRDSGWFFKLTGPKETVEAQRSAFDALIGSLKRGDGGP